MSDNQESKEKDLEQVNLAYREKHEQGHLILVNAVGSEPPDI